MSETTPQFAVKSLVPEDVYTDRQEFLDYFYEYALKAATRRAMSSVLLGKRRMGKTEIFKRVVNRLFFEQDHTDPNAVVPVYYTFPDTVVDRWEFARAYVENLLRWYVAFRWREPDILSEDKVLRNELFERVMPHQDESPEIASMLKILKGIRIRDLAIPEKTVLYLPRSITDRNDRTFVVFLDEFQNTRLHEFNIVGFFQEAVESPTCPHFVTGSAMTILSREILGRGGLFGRFDSNPIEPLTEYWGAQLARRAAGYYHAELAEFLAPVVANRCGGNPFYITAVVRQAAKKGTSIDSENVVNTLLATDLSSGFIWAELNDQVTRWIQRINEYGITKWVLYLSALEEGERIEPEHIQQRLFEKDGQQVDIATIRDVLIRLSRGDLLEYMEFGNWFRKVDDPILLDFLKVWGRFEVEGHAQDRVVRDVVKQYDSLQRRFNDLKGLLGEVYLSQILISGQRKTFPGQYFHSETDITVPHRFLSVHHRMRFDASEESEVDVYASTGTEIWLCESKWWETRPVGPAVVQEMLGLLEKLKDYEGREYFEQEKPLQVSLWLFAHNGVTPEAESLLREHRIYWSTREDLDWLVKHLGLRRLPVPAAATD